MQKKKITVVDICVICLLIVFAAGLGVRFAKITIPKLQKKNLEYTVEVVGIRGFGVDALKQMGTISNGVDTILGEITDVRYEDSEFESVTSDGELKKTMLPEKYNCYVTIRSEATQKDNIYYLDDDEYVIAAGGKFTIISRYVKTEGTITSVTEVE